jgi:hypothetical protein
MSRVSSSERIKLQNRAEVELMRYKDDHALWHKHVHNTALDPMQILKCMEMDQHTNTVDFSCRRTRKTSIKEIYLMKFLATMPMQELGILAPRVQQAQNNLSYHVDAIRRSQILSSYIAVKQGRRQIKDTAYALANGSKAACYGIYSQIDGDSLSAASIEEVDDLGDNLFSRFLPMLGAAARMGADSAIKFDPQIRITGVYKGNDILQTLMKSGEYHTLPTVDVYLGLEMNIIKEDWANSMRAQLPEGEWIRQFLCRNIASTNFIWEKYVRKALDVGLRARLEIAAPLPGKRYKKRGLISFGYDHSGHGESLTASKSALVVTEQIGNYITFPFVKTWAAGTDDKVVELDLLGLWEYFRPDYAMGDAYGIGMMTSLNDRLYANGLADIDRRTIGDGQSTASTWTGWPFAPIRFQGMTKHSMASTLRAAFHNGQAAIPFFDEDAADCAEWLSFIRQLSNIKTEPTKADYSSYKMADPKIGDDLFDAACAGVWALVTRGAEDVATVIATRLQTREQLLGNSPPSYPNPTHPHPSPPLEGEGVRLERMAA